MSLNHEDVERHAWRRPEVKDSRLDRFKDWVHNVRGGTIIKVPVVEVPLSSGHEPLTLVSKENLRNITIRL